jgi:probable HAF family extracellular repeat protein
MKIAVLAVTSFAATAVAGTDPVQYRIFDLGATQTSQTISYATAINSAGTVAGWRYRPLDGFPDAGYRALTWNPAMTQLALPPVADGASALAINSAGVVGGFRNENARNRAVIWTGGVPQELSLPGLNSQINGINDAGQAVGNYDQGSLSSSQGFLWQNAAMTNLGSLGGTQTIARAINNGGVVVGVSRTAALTGRAFRWVNGQMTALSVGGNLASSAYAINELGEIGGFVSPGVGVPPKPAMWSADGTTLTELPLFSGLQEGVIMGLNAHSVAVGYSAQPGERIATMWRNGQVLSLSSLLPSDHGWARLYQATAINDSGMIVGWGRFGSIDNRDHAFLMVPIPSPSGVVVVVGLLPLVARRRRAAFTH